MLLQKNPKPVPVSVSAAAVVDGPSELIDGIFRKDLLAAVQPDIVLRSFDGLGAWQDWSSRNSWATERAYVKSFPAHALDHGVRSIWFGEARGPAVSVDGELPNIEIRVNGMAQWPRGLLDLVAAMRITIVPQAVRIYAAEALSPWALALRGRFPRFVGSEYLPEATGASLLFPVQHQDLQHLQYPAGAFDLALTREVLEHVPEIRAALSELARILRPGGVMLSTFPFRWSSKEGLLTARLKNGEVEHSVATPEYHSDPHRPEGALVFYAPAWDVLDLARETGFSRAAFLFYSSRMGGIVNPHLAGIWIMLAVR